MNKPSKKTFRAKETRENSIGWMLKILCASMDANMTSELKRLDWNLSQFAVLMTLSEIEGITQSEIGKKIIMPGYATTRTIDALEQKNLVERRKDDRSRRSYCIYLTESSRQLQPKLFNVVNNVNEELLSVLTATEQKNLTFILRKLAQSPPG